MHDIRTIRADPAGFNSALARRGLAPASSDILAKDAERRAVLTALQEKQARRNALSREVGQGKRTGANTAALEGEAVALRGEMEALEREAAALDEEIRGILENLPAVLDPDVPDGPDETANVVLKQHGAPRDLGFQPKQHFELGEALGMMDFATAAKLAGTRFVVLRGPLARLERALGQFMIDLHTRDHGHTEMVVPSLVNEATAYGTASLPKFRDDLFETLDGRFLIPTAEVPLTNTVAGEIVAEKDLPIRLTALPIATVPRRAPRDGIRAACCASISFARWSWCRSFIPTTAWPSRSAWPCAEKVLSLLELPFRRVVLSSGDTGFPSARTFDLEVWLPGQQAWREISSSLELSRFSGAADECPVPRGRWQDGRPCAHVERVRRGGWAGIDRGDGEPPAGRRIDPDPGRAMALHGRGGVHRLTRCRVTVATERAPRSPRSRAVRRSASDLP